MKKEHDGPRKGGHKHGSLKMGKGHKESGFVAGPATHLKGAAKSK